MTTAGLRTLLTIIVVMGGIFSSKPASIKSFGPCSVENLPGICTDIDSCQNSQGTVSWGLCPGAVNVVCCTYGICESRGKSGYCQREDSCQGSKAAGVCPGPDDVTCCLKGGCKVRGVAGICKRKQDCKGVPVPGVCEGTDDIQCCPKTVQDVFQAHSCSTLEVVGLSRQLVDEQSCMLQARGDPPLMDMTNCPLIQMEPEAKEVPYAQACVVKNLLAATKERGITIYLHSALRTLVQQLLLHKWSDLDGIGGCYIPITGFPGGSNHNSGGSIDVWEPWSWTSYLEKRGFRAIGPHDPPHFDHLDAKDLRSDSVLAFQRLWNRNHPEDRIAEDGIYGKVEVEPRLLASPASGFRKGAQCWQRTRPRCGSGFVHGFSVGDGQMTDAAERAGLTMGRVLVTCILLGFAVWSLISYRKRKLTRLNEPLLEKQNASQKLSQEEEGTEGAGYEPPEEVLVAPT
eukprot:gb/GEZN01005800.1/.p1 GENE.gb/GEZN01005800.1/~~gb/GEZN01005800.1/.p1  ORF type:complete len:458 (+),score=32.70 gb/GEZN01005800.1/:64-1437(+)